MSRRKPDNVLEKGIPAGTWNKYESRNPVQQFLIRRFENRLRNVLKPHIMLQSSALDIGCGQGRTTRLLSDLGIRNVAGCDFSSEVIAIAQRAHPDLTFFTCDLLKRNSEDEKKTYDLITLIEVLEHIENPEAALKAAVLRSNGLILLTVPDEPVFRILNLMAGKYIRKLGNSPGHVQHWGKRSFLKFISPHIDLITVARSLPWLIVLGNPKCVQ